ncbi:MAG TPA: glycine cleavage system protein GcvH [Gemmatimonadaceae bacterium]|jgi:glycine cleavage system H protein|nr:glycine cleavage system protein GcvH [Gemmatimonadaceae bacterium]
MASKIPTDLLYTKDHEYLRVNGTEPTRVGITDYAQGELGDVVFVELPKVGAHLSAHETFGTIEAVKAVSDLMSPVAGTVLAINPRLDKEPALVNTDPYGDGWMIEIEPAESPAAGDGLLTAQQYAAHVGE